MTAKKTTAALVEKPVAKVPGGTPGPAAGAGSLAEKASTWSSPSSDPRQDICNARAGVRIETFLWPTVLALKPAVFEDLIKHPDTLAFLAAIQADRSYDVRHPAQAAQLLAPWLGVREIRVNADEPIASLS